MVDLEKYLQYESSQGVIEFDSAGPLASIIDGFRKSISGDYPTEPDKNPDGSYAFRSRSSQLILGPERVVLNVEYFGNYNRDFNLCHKYLSEKMHSALNAVSTSVKRPVRFLALITAAQASFNGLSETPTTFLLDHLIKTRVDPSKVEDVTVRIATKVGSRFFVNYEVSNYVTKTLHRKLPAVPGRHEVKVRLHELQLLDTGIKIVVDSNTKLEAFHQLTDYDKTDLDELLTVSKLAVTESIPNLLVKGEI